MMVLSQLDSKAMLLHQRSHRFPVKGPSASTQGLSVVVRGTVCDTVRRAAAEDPHSVPRHGRSAKVHLWQYGLLWNKLCNN